MASGNPKVRAAPRRMLETGRAETVVTHRAAQMRDKGFECRVLLMRRSCLNCGTLFVARGRVNRLCPPCGRKSA